MWLRYWTHMRVNSGDHCCCFFVRHYFIVLVKWDIFFFRFFPKKNAKYIYMYIYKDIYIYIYIYRNKTEFLLLFFFLVLFLFWFFFDVGSCNKSILNYIELFLYVVCAANANYCYNRTIWECLTWIIQYFWWHVSLHSG